jgi:hypothetical protein
MGVSYRDSVMKCSPIHNRGMDDCQEKANIKNEGRSLFFEFSRQMVGIKELSAG